MHSLYKIAHGLNNRFPEGNEPFQIMTRVLEECGEVAKEVNNREGSGVKRLKNGEPSRENLAHEIRQSLTALAQLAVYYGVENELEADIEITIEKMKREGLIAE